MPYRLFLPMLVTVLCLASGCVRMPQPQGFPYSNQPKMQAAHHWNVLANDVANRINNELIRRNYLDSALHVRHNCTKPDGCGPGSASPFDEGFNDLLTTQLVDQGNVSPAGRPDSPERIRPAPNCRSDSSYQDRRSSATSGFCTPK